MGADWRGIADAERDLYFHRENGRWRLVAVRRHESGAREWRADYREFENDFPRSVRLTSMTSSRFDLRLKLSQVEINAPLGADAFEVRVPPTASPITLDELRESGPLATPSKRTRDANGR